MMKRIMKQSSVYFLQKYVNYLLNYIASSLY